jgi:glycosyltransferase involved in cell wall biosynthesis
MILVSHPTGNANVRALLQGSHQAGRLGLYATTLGFAGEPRWLQALPESFRREMARRCYMLPTEKLSASPALEATRLLSQRLGLQGLTRQEVGMACVDAVYARLDRGTAAALPAWQHRHGLRAAYAYEDGALETLRAARRLGMKAVYELPIAYWQTGRGLLEEEARRLPEWASTLVGTADSSAKLERKTAEMLAAEIVVCPSRFVLDSIPAALKAGRRCVVAEFGSPAAEPGAAARVAPRGRPMRFLFAGSMTQRKGLADVFAAFRLLARRDIELVVLGSPLLPMSFYENQGVAFTHEPTRPHADVLQLMDRCDVFVLPSIVEGRALVQQEAMSRGLPLIVTRNAGGEDLVEEGRTGFLVPIRSPEALAQKIDWMADHPDQLPAMSMWAREAAARYTWQSYADKILAELN